MLYTVGHSNQSLDAFLALVRQAGIEQIADVRRYPASRRWPHFNSGALARALEASGLGYRHFEALGGMRDPSPYSKLHGALELPWQRDYAAYMNTGRYRAVLGELVEWSRNRPTAVLCAEAKPEGCHRFLLSDALLREGVSVTHVTPGGSRPHRYPPTLRVDGEHLMYDQGVLPLGL